MREQRRHQRIRFNLQPRVNFGQAGGSGGGRLENLSLGGLMLCAELPLKVGDAFGCDFSISGPVRIDISAVVVGCIGNLYSARFEAGPVSERLLKDEIDRALSSGEGSVLSVNELQGRRVMRVQGGLNGSLRNDFMNSLSRMSVNEIDLSKVTAIDRAGTELCRIAVQTRQIMIVQPSCRISSELAAIAGWRSD